MSNGEAAIVLIAIQRVFAQKGIDCVEKGQIVSAGKWHRRVQALDRAIQLLEKDYGVDCRQESN